MKRIVSRKLPLGEIKDAQPFHICMKGLEKAILCRDDEDYGVMVKYIAVCARRKNVIVIIYCVVSNHCHVAILAATYEDASAFAAELKRTYAQWFQIKYQEKQILKGVDIKALFLDNDWYVRNTLAYIPLNALDNGFPIDQYRWSGYQAMFKVTKQPAKGLSVSKLSRRGQDRVMHTRETLKDVPWLVDTEGDLIPETFCDTDYLEQAFNHDQAFWLKTIGAVNSAEMEEKLVDAPRRLLPDSELHKEVSDIALRWFSKQLSELTKENKKRLLPYLWRTRKTTIPQLARVLGLERDVVSRGIKIRKTGDGK